MLGREWFREKNSRQFISHRYSTGDIRENNAPSGRHSVAGTSSRSTIRLPPGGLEKSFPAKYQIEALKNAVDRSLADRRRIPHPARGWTGGQVSPKFKERYLGQHRPASTTEEPPANNGSRGASRAQSRSNMTTEEMARERLIAYVERRTTGQHPPTSWAPRMTSEQLNPGLTRPTQDWISHETKQVLRRSRTALSTYMQPTPPATARFSSPEPSMISTFNGEHMSLDGSNGSPAFRIRRAPSRNGRNRARSEPMQKTLWNVGPPHLENKQLEMEAAWASLSSPKTTNSPSRGPRYAETLSGRMVELSPASAVGFAFAGRSLPTLQRDGLYSSAGQNAENISMQRNDPTVLTHGERGEDGASLGRFNPENQGLGISIDVGFNRHSKLREMKMKWQPPKQPPNYFLPPTTPF